jgi:hypothetical protein
MTLYRIEGEFQVHELEGERVAGPVSTRPHPITGKPRARWTEWVLYKPDSGGYVLHKVNQSRVWHAAGGAGHIRIPAEVRITDLPEDAVYCAMLPARGSREQCPPMAGADLSLVLAEQPQYGVFRCADEREVRVRLADAFRAMEDRNPAEADPVRRLLAEAARNDPAFAAGTKPVVTI